MELIKTDTHIDFMGRRRIAAVLSAIVLLVAIGSMIINRFELGLDFTGGTLIELGYEQPPVLANIRSALNDAGFDGALVQTFGSARDILVRLPVIEDVNNVQLSNQVMEALSQGVTASPPEMRRTEFVGPQVGQELAEKGGLAMLYALIAILIYIVLRFQWRFAVGAVTALIHDVIVVLGVFSLFGIEFDLTVMAAVLAVIGYSLNDTIVVYDRVRENFRSLRKAEPVDVFNRSINQMLARTLMTSLTTLIVLIALFLLGGEIIHGFALALIVGVVVGTYSSIYVAGAAALALGVSKQDLMKPEKEGADAEPLPGIR